MAWLRLKFDKRIFNNLVVKNKKEMEKTQLKRNTIYTLVVGLGVTGLSVVRYLRGLGERVVVVDSRDLPPGMKILKESLDIKILK